MMKFASHSKLLIINILLAFVGSLIISELFLRVFRPKFPMEVFGSSYTERLKEAKKDSLKDDDLILVVGDSFAHHQIGTNGNFFDATFNCDTNIKCNYHNLAQSGEGLAFYWNTILSATSNRKQGYQTKIIIGVYLGNDIPFINQNKSSNFCKKRHIFNPEMIAQKNDNWKRSLKRKLPSVLFLARKFKEFTGLGNKEKMNSIYANAKELRFYRSDQNKNLDSIKSISSKINPDIIDAASRDIINPWEVSLALANPYYYDELYNLSSKWSKKSVNCLIDNIVSNVSAIKEEQTDTEFLIIGIPDKFYWSKVSYRSTVKEYQELGYRFRPRKTLQRIKNNPLSEIVKKRLTSNGIKYIYIPDMISKEKDIVDWFYHKDMHINTKGNQKISEILKKIDL